MKRKSGLPFNAQYKAAVVTAGYATIAPPPGLSGPGGSIAGAPAIPGTGADPLAKAVVMVLHEPPFKCFPQPPQRTPYLNAPRRMCTNAATQFTCYSLLLVRVSHTYACSFRRAHHLTGGDPERA